jgi:hypothetical protein
MTTREQELESLGASGEEEMMLQLQEPPRQ